jgi:3-methyladenine DNA glycosylase AlkD
VNLQKAAGSICNDPSLRVKAIPTLPSKSDLKRDENFVYLWSAEHRSDELEQTMFRSLAYKYRGNDSTASAVKQLENILDNWEKVDHKISTNVTQLTVMESHPNVANFQTHFLNKVKEADQLLVKEVRVVDIPLSSLFKAC